MGRKQSLTVCLWIFPLRYASSVSRFPKGRPSFHSSASDVLCPGHTVWFPTALALRKLSPAKLEGRDKGDLISVITSDIELLEVFYAHTISDSPRRLSRTNPLKSPEPARNSAAADAAVRPPLTFEVTAGIAIPTARYARRARIPSAGWKEPINRHMTTV